MISLGLITQIFLAGEKINDPLAMYSGDIMTVFNTFFSFVDVDLYLLWNLFQSTWWQEIIFDLQHYDSRKKKSEGFEITTYIGEC